MRVLVCYEVGTNRGYISGHAFVTMDKLCEETLATTAAELLAGPVKRDAEAAGLTLRDTVIFRSVNRLEE